MPSSGAISRYLNLDSDIPELTTTASTLQSDVAAVVDETAEAQQQIEATHEHTLTMNERLTRLEEQTASVRQRIDGVGEQIGRARERMERLSGAVNSAQTDVALATALDESLAASMGWDGVGDVVVFLESRGEQGAVGMRERVTRSGLHVETGDLRDDGDDGDEDEEDDEEEDDEDEDENFEDEESYTRDQIDYDRALRRQWGRREDAGEERVYNAHVFGARPGFSSDGLAGRSGRARGYFGGEMGFAAGQHRAHPATRPRRPHVHRDINGQPRFRAPGYGTTGIWELDPVNEADASDIESDYGEDRVYTRNAQGRWTEIGRIEFGQLSASAAGGSVHRWNGWQAMEGGGEFMLLRSLS